MGQRELINEEKQRRIRKIELWKRIHQQEERIRRMKEDEELKRREQQQQEEKEDAIFDKENKHEKIPIKLRSSDGRLHQYFSNNVNNTSKTQCDGKRMLGTDKQQNRL